MYSDVSVWGRGKGEDRWSNHHIILCGGGGQGGMHGQVRCIYIWNDDSGRGDGCICVVDGRGSDTCDVRCVHCICVMVFVSGGEGVERYIYECKYVWGCGGGGGRIHGYMVM